MKRVIFERQLSGGSSYRLGTAVEYRDGWRFISNVTSHKGSRKFHATMEKCVPRWVGYPDKCVSQTIEA
jgi:mRNA-degrading endonuclease HigB of HigAB toxin-antitoxin module